MECALSGKPKAPKRLYSDYVKGQSSCNPCLLNLERFLSTHAASHRSCRIVALDFREGVKGLCTRSHVALHDLPSKIRRMTNSENCYKVEYSSSKISPKTLSSYSVSNWISILSSLQCICMHITGKDYIISHQAKQHAVTALKAELHQYQLPSKCDN